MKRRGFLTGAAVLTAGMIMFSSCDNVKTDDRISITDIEVESAEDDALVDDLYNSMDTEIDADVASLDASGYNVSSLKSSDEETYACKVITVDHPNDSTIFPKVITIDFGEGCTVEINGKKVTRKGKIQIKITNRWFVKGASRTITFIDFYINDAKIEGTRSVTNEGKNDRGNLEFKVVLRDGKVIFNDTLEYTRECERTREWVRAEDPKDNIWYITGACSGVNLDGYRYSHTIIEKLMIVRCADFRFHRMIVDGVVEIVRNGQTAKLDYGNGACDDKAILTIDGESKEINVRKRYHNKRRAFAKRIVR